MCPWHRRLHVGAYERCLPILEAPGRLVPCTRQTQHVALLTTTEKPDHRALVSCVMTCVF